MKPTALAAALGLAFAATLSVAADPVAPAQAPAAQPHKGDAAARFKKIDTNGDGKISRDEAKANAPRMSAHFDAIDANKDGFITPDELAAARAKRAQASTPK